MITEGRSGYESGVISMVREGEEGSSMLEKVKKVAPIRSWLGSGKCGGRPAGLERTTQERTTDS